MSPKDSAVDLTEVQDIGDLQEEIPEGVAEQKTWWADEENAARVQVSRLSFDIAEFDNLLTCS
jgi:hypothetical protein